LPWDLTASGLFILRKVSHASELQVDGVRRRIDEL
jgi:hypothetical protein